MRDYNRNDKYRDCIQFYISTEGGKREPGYFSLFDLASNKLKVEIVGDCVWSPFLKKRFETKSSPEWVLSRTKRFIKENDIRSTDHLHFIIDVDQWSPRQLKAIANFCRRKPNWEIVLSNPCFEVFLILGKLKEIPFPFDKADKKSKQLKTTLAELDPGGYNRYNYVRLAWTSVENARKLERGSKGIIPAPHTTQVYKTVEKIINFIGVNDFNRFIEKTIPEQIAKDKMIIKSKYKKEEVSS
ncbi:RloB domain-containing protein [Chitinophaga sancti]|uniref:RloB domain-containing protein n=1 Tax=Chitinophaga sancti TaxID=1004 RepID=A0A1K1S7K0_9BACT|nr:RloB domain-containing protein [Chitinophaga sancti]WQD62180.1 RloB domain-containing protein [Chitinophaga sancti]WQG92251.1 RloB domain-containing protein [Chitinophaga sancti]SFW80063.1 RloB-like protein [Chitinophaga sancti]